MQFKIAAFTTFVAATTASSITSMATLPTGAALIPFVNSELQQLGVPLTIPTNLPPAASAKIASLASMFASEAKVPGSLPTIMAQVSSLIHGPDLFTVTSYAGAGATPTPTAAVANGTVSIATGAATPLNVAFGGVLAAAGLAVAAVL